MVHSAGSNSNLQVPKLSCGRSDCSGLYSDDPEAWATALVADVSIADTTNGFSILDALLERLFKSQLREEDCPRGRLHLAVQFAKLVRMFAQDLHSTPSLMPYLDAHLEDEDNREVRQEIQKALQYVRLQEYLK
jgi:hypothetical protein